MQCLLHFEPCGRIAAQQPSGCGNSSTAIALLQSLFWLTPWLRLPHLPMSSRGARQRRPLGENVVTTRASCSPVRSLIGSVFRLADCFAVSGATDRRPNEIEQAASSARDFDLRGNCCIGRRCC